MVDRGKLCPYDGCQYVNPPQARFCGRCGRSVQTTTDENSFGASSTSVPTQRRSVIEEKAVLIWLRKEVDLGSDDAVAKAEQISSSCSPERFEVVKRMFSWLNEGAELCPQHLNSADALAKAEELSCCCSPERFELMKQMFSWLNEGAELCPQHLDSEDALAKAEQLSSAFTLDRFALMKQVFSWLTAGEEGYPQHLDSEDALAKAEELSAYYTSSDFDRLREIFSWACSSDGPDLDSEAALDYAIKKVVPAR